jgi:hypothetical protein
MSPLNPIDFRVYFEVYWPLEPGSETKLLKDAIISINNGVLQELK